jgi:uncharacterized membrane protein
MPNKWLDRTQPQTLYMATLLMYFNAGLSLLFGATYFNVSVFGIHHGSLIIGLLLIVGQVVGGRGIANEKKWGYAVAVVVAVLLLAETLLSFFSGALLTLIFEIALVALLLHPQSREYRRIWFR